MQSSLGRGDKNLRDFFGRATARGHVCEKGEIKRVIKNRHISVTAFGGSIIVWQIPTMFSVIVGSVWLFIAPSSLAHFRVESSQFVLAADAVIVIKVRIAVIETNFFSFSI